MFDLGETDPYDSLDEDTAKSNKKNGMNIMDSCKQTATTKTIHRRSSREQQKKTDITNLFDTTDKCDNDDDRKKKVEKLQRMRQYAAKVDSKNRIALRCTTKNAKNLNDSATLTKQTQVMPNRRSSSRRSSLFENIKDNNQTLECIRRVDELSTRSNFRLSSQPKTPAVEQCSKIYKKKAHELVKEKNLVPPIAVSKRLHELLALHEKNKNILKTIFSDYV